MEITVKDFLRMQPNNPQVAETDKYYLMLAVRLARLCDESQCLTSVSDAVRRDVVLAVVGYYQDVVADAGIWRWFSTLHSELYGSPVPFYEVGDDYVESELNEVDVRFIIWYVLEGSMEEKGLLSPYDKDIATLAHLFFEALDEEYEEAPNPVEYSLAWDVEIHNTDDARKLYDLSYWLFWNSYFMRHSASGAMAEAQQQAGAIIAKHPDRSDAMPLLADLNDDVMMQNPTGPLALFVGEWIEMLVDGKHPNLIDDPTKVKGEPHKFYKQLLAGNDGKEIAFFDSYDALEAFLSDRMGWGEKPEGHLPHLRQYSNFVILGTPARGILIAPEVGAYVAHADNPAYDKKKAQAEAHTLITQYGRCPIDLVKYLFRNNLVPDARLPHDVSGDMLAKHWDFLARLYQQKYYRAD